MTIQKKKIQQQQRQKKVCVCMQIEIRILISEIAGRNPYECIYRSELELISLVYSFIFGDIVTTL